MENLRELREAVEEWVNAKIQAVMTVLETINLRLGKIDQELDTVRKQNEQLGKDIAGIHIPEMKDPLTEEQVRRIVREEAVEERNRNRNRWILSVVFNVLMFSLIWAIAHWLYG